MEERDMRLLGHVRYVKPLQTCHQILSPALWFNLAAALFLERLRALLWSIGEIAKLA